MKKIIPLLIITILLVSTVHASPYATIAMEAGKLGLGFVNPQVASAVNVALCLTNPLVCAQGKIVGYIIGQAYQTAITGVAQIAGEQTAQAVDKAYTTYSQIKGYVNKGAQILNEIKLDSSGKVEQGEIQFQDKEAEIKNLIGGNVEGDILVKQVKLKKEKGISTITFTGETGVLNINGDEYTNIKKYSDITHAYVKLNEQGIITEADFTTNEKGGRYLIGADYIPVPPNSRLTFIGSKAQVYVAEGSEFKDIQASLKSFDKTHYDIGVMGRNVKLPDGLILQDGRIVYNSNYNNPIIKHGEYAKISNLLIAAGEEDVNILYQESVDSGSIKKLLAEEEFYYDNKVKFYDSGKVKISGRGYTVKMNPNAFIKGEESSNDMSYHIKITPDMGSVVISEYPNERLGLNVIDNVKMDIGSRIIETRDFKIYKALNSDTLVDPEVPINIVYRDYEGDTISEVEVDSNRIETYTEGGKLSLSLRGKLESLKTTYKLAVGDIEDIQKKVNAIAAKKENNQEITKEDKEFLKGLYGVALPSGALVKSNLDEINSVISKPDLTGLSKAIEISKQISLESPSGEALIHYIDGTGKPLQISPNFLTKDPLIKEVMQPMQEELIKRIKGSETVVISSTDMGVAELLPTRLEESGKENRYGTITDGVVRAGTNNRELLSTLGHFAVTVEGKVVDGKLYSTYRIKDKYDFARDVNIPAGNNKKLTLPAIINDKVLIDIGARSYDITTEWKTICNLDLTECYTEPPG